MPPAETRRNAPPSCAIQSNLETVGDEVHFVIFFRPLAVFYPVKDLPVPGSVVVGRSFMEYSLSFDRHLLQRVNQIRVSGRQEAQGKLRSAPRLRRFRGSIGWLNHLGGAFRRVSAGGILN